METFNINQMKKLTYKTNIKCNGCITTVTPFLAKIENVARWYVDLESVDKIMTVEFDELNTGEVESVLKEAGYEATLID